MDVPFQLSEAQMRRIKPFFPLPHGIPRVDDRRIVSAVIYVIKHGLIARPSDQNRWAHVRRPRWCAGPWELMAGGRAWPIAA